MASSGGSALWGASGCRLGSGRGWGNGALPLLFFNNDVGVVSDEVGNLGSLKGGSGRGV